MGEIVELRERFDARIPRTDEDEAELLASVGSDRRALELLEEAVSECDGVGQVLESQPVLSEARNGKKLSSPPPER